MADIEQLNAEVQDIKRDLKGIGEALNRIAIQEERLNHLDKSLGFAWERISELAKSTAGLQQGQDKFSGFVQAIERSIDSIVKMVEGLQKDHSALQQAHDRCQINTIGTEIAWMKWFVMGNCMASIAMFLGLVGKYLFVK